MQTETPTPQPHGVDRSNISRLVHQFYADVRSDELLGPTFDAVIGNRWDAHLARMVEFWSTVMLGTRSFSGNVVGKHMAVPGVTPEHFRHWLAFWFARTSALFAPGPAAELKQVGVGIARNLHRGYFDDAADFDGIELEMNDGAR